MNNRETLLAMARAARAAASSSASLSTALKNTVLAEIARELNARREWLREENGKDMRRAEQQGMSPAMRDRLALSDKAITEMIDALSQVAALNDPIGEVVRMWRRPNDLLVGKVRIPIGVIGIIYESRPNVTADAASLCFKTGNATILSSSSG